MIVDQIRSIGAEHNLQKDLYETLAVVTTCFTQ